MSHSINSPFKDLLRVLDGREPPSIYTSYPCAIVMGILPRLLDIRFKLMFFGVSLDVHLVECGLVERSP